jgi:hypothetical protein
MTEPTKAEKLAAYLNDQRLLRQPAQPTTFFQMQHVADELEAQGRHSADATKPATQYPALPEGSPWSRQEPPEPTINGSSLRPCGHGGSNR